MSVKKTIELEAKTSDATKGFDKLAESIDQLNKNFGNLQKTQKETTDQIADDAKKTRTALGKIGGAIGKVGKGFKGMGLALKGLGLGLIIKAVDSLTESFSGNQVIVDQFNKVFKTIQIIGKEVVDIFKPIIERVIEATGGFDALKQVLGGALTISVNTLLLGIQGITIGVQSAQLAWEKSFFGGKDENKIKELQANIDETKNKIGETADRIKDGGKQVADGFVEAVGEVGSLVTGVVEATTKAVSEINVGAAAEQAAAIVETEKNFERLAQQQQRLVEEYDRDAERLRQQRDDESLTIQERIEANEKLAQVLLDQNDAEQATIQARIDAINKKIEAEGKSVELSNELYDLNTELLAVEAKVTGFQSEQQTNANALKKEALELDQSRKEAINELGFEQARIEAESITNEQSRLERLIEINEAEREAEVKRLEEKRNAAKEGTQAFVDAQNEIDAVNQEAANNETNLEKQKNLNKKMLMTQALNDAVSILGKNSKAGKAIAIVQAIRDTFAGANKALASAPPPFNFISAAAVVAAGIKNVKTITATKDNPAQSASGSTTPSASSSSGPSSAPPAFNVVGDAGTDQLATALGEAANKPQRSYVVSDDVSTAQALDRNIIETAGL